MFRRILTVAICGLATLSTTVAEATAGDDQLPQNESTRQSKNGSSTDSNGKAVEIVNRAATSSGGLEKIKGLSAISFDYAGHVAAAFQGLNPSDPHKQLPVTGNIAFNIAGDELFNNNQLKWPNFTAVSNSVHKAGESYEIDEPRKSYSKRANSNVVRIWKFRLSPLLIRQLLKHTASTRYDGRRKLEGQIFDVLSSKLGGNKEYRFYFSTDTGRLLMTEHQDYSSNFGEMLVKTVFASFEAIDGLVMPVKVRSFYNGELIADYTYNNVRSNQNAKLDKISLPADYRLAERTANASAMRTHKIAEDVFLIENLANRDYNVMFADLGDFLIVFEAPIENWASKIAIEEIRKIYPAKPIRYVMVTHFHDDHAGGARKYMSDGVAVITSPGNKSFFEKVAALKHRPNPENNSLVVPRTRFALVKDKFYEIKGKNLTVQFHDLGPTSHADEILVAYIPERSILFQGDFFRVSANRSEPESLRDEGLVFYQKIKEKNFKFTQLAGAHGAIGDKTDLEKSYQLRMKN